MNITHEVYNVHPADYESDDKVTVDCRLIVIVLLRVRELREATHQITPVTNMGSNLSIVCTGLSRR